VQSGHLIVDHGHEQRAAREQRRVRAFAQSVDGLADAGGDEDVLHQCRTPFASNLSIIDIIDAGMILSIVGSGAQRGQRE
jgi:hypothetical protein